jgi:hypothetical protein
MNTLSNLRKGVQPRPHFIGLYGPGGVGKSTFAASAPKPIFLGTDDGVGSLDVTSFPIPTTWAEVKASINDLLMENHEFETLAIDTVNGLEPLLWHHIIKEARVKSIEEVDGGFGKGYLRAYEQWVDFWSILKKLRNKMNVIALGHAKIKSFEDPYQNERFDKFIMKMNVEAAALFHESVDCMFFANYQTTYRKEKGARKAKAFGEGKRVMFTEERPAFAAKSRFDLPFEMDLSWDEFIAAVAKCVPTVKATPDKLLELFKGTEEQALAYLINIGWLREGQALADLPAAKRKPILSRSEDFLKAVRDYSTQEPETEETTEPSQSDE